MMENFKAKIGAKIKDEIELQDKLKKKRIYNEFETKILENAESIEQLIASIDENNNDLRNDIDECNDEMFLCQEEKRKQNLPFIPGQNIKKLMDKWNQNIDDQGMTEDEVFKYASELTISLQEYETYLKN